MRETDLADELFGQPGKTALPAGVRVATARQGGVTITRVEIAREGLARPRGRYVTLEVPSVSLLDERDSAVIEAAAAELRPLLPPEGPVLVLGGGQPPGHGGCSGPPHGAEGVRDHGAAHRAGAGHPAGGGCGSGGVGGHGPELTAAGRGAGTGAAARRPALCGQPLLC